MRVLERLLLIRKVCAFLLLQLLFTSVRSETKIITDNLGRVVDLRYHEAHRTMMKLHNIVVSMTFNVDMFQG